SAFVGVIIGAGLSVVASHRLGGGGVPAWAPVGAAVGGATGASAAGLGLVCSGRRGRPGMGLGLAGAVIAWAGLDVILGRVTSPMGLIGELALIPLRFHPGSVGVAAVIVAVVVFGVLGV